LESESAGVEKRLDKIDEKLGRIFDRLDEVVPAVARLEVKAGVWGGVGGLAAALVTIALAFVVRLL
jgi:tetrahydromethanopterin S-methyltransferase subunit G